jgi:hypothetical protein
LPDVPAIPAYVILSHVIGGIDSAANAGGQYAVKRARQFATAGSDQSRVGARVVLAWGVSHGGAERMIIRHKHKSRFTVVPNAIFDDGRLSLGAKGLLGYLLSRPGNWQVRHGQLQYKFKIGRKQLNKFILELDKAGYLARDGEQGRDEQNRFMPYNYVVRDLPELSPSDAPAALRPEPLRNTDTGNKKEEIKTDFTKPFPKPLSSEQAESKIACQDKYSELGEHARAAGNHPVYVGSEPHKAWCAYRGDDGMPGFVDQAVIGGKLRKIVWMPTVFPPKGAAKTSSGQGGGQTWDD